MKYMQSELPSNCHAHSEVIGEIRADVKNVIRSVERIESKLDKHEERITAVENAQAQSQGGWKAVVGSGLLGAFLSWLVGGHK